MSDPMRPDPDKSEFNSNVEKYWEEVTRLTRIPNGAQRLRTRLKQVGADSSIVHVPPARLADAIDQGWTEKEIPEQPSDAAFKEWVNSLRTPGSLHQVSDLF
jgi:hypothetical protein